MDILKIAPWPECEKSAYAQYEPEEIYNLGAQLHVPHGYEGIVWKDMHNYEILMPGDYELGDRMQRVKKVIGRSYLAGKVAYINKSISELIEWGTGRPVSYFDKTLEHTVTVAFSGSLNVRVDLSEPFIKYISSGNIKKITLRDIIKDRAPAFINALSPALKYFIEENNLDFRMIPTKLREISDSAELRIRPVFTQIGLWVSDLVITGYVFP